MSELLNIEPPELKFPFWLKKKNFCKLQLSNNTESHLAFKVLTTNPKKYCVRPNRGIIQPRSTCEIIVETQAQNEPPVDMLGKDKFKIQSTVVSPATVPKDITREMFKGESGLVKEYKLGVVYMSPLQPCLSGAVKPGSYSPKLSLTENGNLNHTQTFCSVLQDTGAISNTKNNLSEGEKKTSVVKLLKIEPTELKFPFELKKQTSCSLYLSNVTNSIVAFKVKTTNPKSYCVRPNTGMILPQATCAITVIMQARNEAPVDMQCKDKFLIHSVVASPWDILIGSMPDMFSKEAGRSVEEFKLHVVLLSPPLPLLQDSDGFKGSLVVSVKGDMKPNSFEVAGKFFGDHDKKPDVAGTFFNDHDKKSDKLMRYDSSNRKSFLAFTL